MTDSKFCNHLNLSVQTRAYRGMHPTACCTLPAQIGDTQFQPWQFEGGGIIFNEKQRPSENFFRRPFILLKKHSYGILIIIMIN